MSFHIGYRNIVKGRKCESVRRGGGGKGIRTANQPARPVLKGILYRYLVEGTKEGVVVLSMTIE